MFCTSAGIRIFCSEERSQLKNKTRAMEILKSKLFAMELEKRDEEIRARRKDQVLALALQHVIIKLKLLCEATVCKQPW